MKYELGLMDMYSIEASGTNIENDPMFKVTMKEQVDPIRLQDAVHRAIMFHPLFGTQVEYDRGYYLTTNSRPVKLIHADEAGRPFEFCKGTNGYPWQMCWYGKDITFEWCHGVTDGHGALDFLRTVLCIYCGMKYPVVPRRVNLGPGLEPFVDRKEKGIDFNVQPKGFSVSSLPIHDRGYKTDCHMLEAPTHEILEAAKRCGSNPSAVLAVLLSQALRGHLPEKASNRNVACNIVLDLRKPLGYETMHNCAEYKRVTYQNHHDSMSFAEVCSEYKAILDNARQKENIVRIITERVNMFRAYHIFKGRKVRKFILKMIGKFLKDSDCNCVLTYVGQCGFPEEVMAHVEDLQLRCWHDFGECLLAAIDFNGVMKINICENYIEKGIVEDFARLCRTQGINMKITGDIAYEQRRFVEEFSA